MFKNYWNGKPEKEYHRMKLRHSRLWNFVVHFISEHTVNSVVEVGGGLCSPVPYIVDDYTGIDINVATDAIHTDFCSIDTSVLTGRDLLLACGVIEHVRSHRKFMSQTLLCAAKYSIVSFFGGVCRPQTDMYLSGKKLVPIKKYAREDIESGLVGCDYQWIGIGERECVLVVNR